MEVDHTSGAMENFITANGNKVKCKEKVNTILRLEYYIRVNLKMIKDMEKVKAFTSYLKFIKDPGRLI
jgi:hypothetical protein